MTTCPTPHRNDQTCWFCKQNSDGSQYGDRIFTEDRNAVLMAEWEDAANVPPFCTPDTRDILRLGRQGRKAVLTQLRACIEVYFRDKGAL